VLHDAAVLLMAVAVVIAVVTGFDYVRQAFRLRRRPDGPAAGPSQGAEPLATDGSDAR
jgi:hypothetical protein